MENKGVKGYWWLRGGEGLKLEGRNSNLCARLISYKTREDGKKFWGGKKGEKSKQKKTEKWGGSGGGTRD